MAYISRRDGCGRCAKRVVLTLGEIGRHDIISHRLVGAYVLKRFAFSLLVSAAFTTSALARPAAPSPAAAPTGEATGPSHAPQVVISGWTLECTSHSSTLGCEVSDRVTAGTSSHTLIGAVVVRLNGPDRTPTFIIHVPLGTAVADPVSVELSKEIATTIPFVTCTPSGCFASAPIPSSFLAAMRTAKAPLRVEFHLLDANLRPQTTTIIMGLDGFSTVYAKL